MSFRENILRKIEIHRLCAQIVESLISKGDIQRVDKKAMRELLALAGYRRIDERDLELYVPPGETRPEEILVLDNGLAVYRTTVADVAMRKSPTVREMISLRNVVRILKDDDVLVSKKGETVERVKKECIDALDLSFTREDLDRLRLDGAASLESRYPEGVIECLTIFGELLDFQPPPKSFRVRHCFVTGKRSAGTSGDTIYGPIAMYDRMHHTLKWIDRPIRKSDREAMSAFHRITDDREKAPVEGIAVFDRLMAAVIESQRV